MACVTGSKEETAMPAYKDKEKGTWYAKAVKNLLDSSGIRYTYLPPYSPEMNPIEKLWSKVKALLRKFKARSLDALPNAIQHAFQNVSPSDCSGWFRSCGYAL